MEEKVRCRMCNAEIEYGVSKCSECGHPTKNRLTDVKHTRNQERNEIAKKVTNRTINYAGTGKSDGTVKNSFLKAICIFIAPFFLYLVFISIPAHRIDRALPFIIIGYLAIIFTYVYLDSKY